MSTRHTLPQIPDGISVTATRVHAMHRGDEIAANEARVRRAFFADDKPDNWTVAPYEEAIKDVE